MYVEKTDMLNEVLLRFFGFLMIALGIVLVFSIHHLLFVLALDFHDFSHQISMDASGFGMALRGDAGDWWFAIFILMTGLIGFWVTTK